MHILPAKLLKCKCCVSRKGAFAVLVDMLKTGLEKEIGPKGWQTSMGVGLSMENADEEWIWTLDLTWYGWHNCVEFCKLQGRH